MDVLASTTMNDVATCDKRWQAAGLRESSISGTHHVPSLWVVILWQHKVSISYIRHARSSVIIKIKILPGNNLQWYLSHYFGSVFVYPLGVWFVSCANGRFFILVGVSTSSIITNFLLEINCRRSSILLKLHRS
jgi:hypothetical protein